MRRALLMGLIIATAGCGATLSRRYSTETAGNSSLVLQAARSVLGSYQIPVRDTGMDQEVQSDYFDPTLVWTAGELSERVQCHDPRKPKDVAEPGRMSMSARVSVAPARSEAATQGSPAMRARTVAWNVTVYLASHGKRADGASCSFTQDFSETLLAQITAGAGSPGFDNKAASN